MRSTFCSMFLTLIIFTQACGLIEKENKNKAALAPESTAQSIVILGSLGEEFALLTPNSEKTQDSDWKYSGGFPISGSQTGNDFTCVSPSHILSDGSFGFYISCSINSQIVYIPSQTLVPTHSFKITEGGNPMGMALTDSKNLLVAAWGLDQLEVFDSKVSNDLKNKKTLSLPKLDSAAGGFPSSVIAHNDRIFLSLNNIGEGFQPRPKGGQLVEVSGNELTVRNVFETGYSNANSLVLAADRSILFVLNAGGFANGGYTGDGGVSVFDLASNTFTESYPLPSPSALVELDNNRLLIADHSGETLRVLNRLDGTSNEVNLEIASLASCGTSSSPQAKGFISSLLKVEEEIFVLEFSRDCLVILDERTLQVKTAVRVVDGPVGLAFLRSKFTNFDPFQQ